MINKQGLHKLPGFEYGPITVGHTPLMYIGVLGNPTTEQYLTCNAHLFKLFDASPYERVDVLANLLRCTGIPSGFFTIIRGSSTHHPKVKRIHIAGGPAFILRIAEVGFKVLRKGDKLSFDKTLEEAEATIMRLNSR